MKLFSVKWVIPNSSDCFCSVRLYWRKTKRLPWSDISWLNRKFPAVCRLNGPKATSYCSDYLMNKYFGKVHVDSLCHVITSSDSRLITEFSSFISRKKSITLEPNILRLPLTVDIVSSDYFILINVVTLMNKIQPKGKSFHWGNMVTTFEYWDIPWFSVSTRVGRFPTLFLDDSETGYKRSVIPRDSRIHEEIFLPEYKLARTENFRVFCTCTISSSTGLAGWVAFNRFMQFSRLMQYLPRCSILYEPILSH